MNIKTMIAVGSLFLLAGPMALACDYPDRPTMPDGSTATKEEMLAAKDAVTAYLAGVDEYLVCIENEEKAALEQLADPSEDERKRRDELLNKKFDAANDEKALIGEEFNAQVRAYNAARASQ